MYSKVFVILVSVYVVILSITFNSCGRDNKIFSSIVDDNPSPEPTKEAEIENPICTPELTSFGSKTEHVYKPVAEGGGVDYSGNVVFIIDSRFQKQFSKCSIELKNGSFADLTCVDDQPWTGIPYSCFGNKDRFGGYRQQWRSTVKATQVKKNAIITCGEAKQECNFKLCGAGTQRCE